MADINGYYRSYTTGVGLDLFSFGDDPRCEDLVQRGTFETMSIRILNFLIEDTKTFFDVGAHSGIYSLTACALNASLNVFAFEPHPLTFARLILHIKTNKFTERIFPIFGAVGDPKRQSNFFLTGRSKKSFGWLSSGSHLHKEEFSLSRSNRALTWTYKPEIYSLNMFKVGGGHNYGLKIDVEGGEVGIYRDAPNFLLCADWVIVECLSVDQVQTLNKIYSEFDGEHVFFQIDEVERTLTPSHGIIAGNGKTVFNTLVLRTPANEKPLRKFLEGFANT